MKEFMVDQHRPPSTAIIISSRSFMVEQKKKEKIEWIRHPPLTLIEYKEKQRTAGQTNLFHQRSTLSQE